MKSQQEINEDTEEQFLAQEAEHAKKEWRQIVEDYRLALCEDEGREVSFEEAEELYADKAAAAQERLEEGK